MKARSRKCKKLNVSNQLIVNNFYLDHPLILSPKLQGLCFLYISRLQNLSKVMLEFMVAVWDSGGAVTRGGDSGGFMAPSSSMVLLR